MRIALCFAAVLGSCQCQSTTSKPTTASGSGSGSAALAGTLGIKLPPLSGKPPVKTSAPLTKPQYDRLAEMTFDDFKVEVTNFPQAIGIRQRAATRPRMSVNISITPCDAQHECLPMKVEAWRAKEAQLKKEMVDEDIVDRPDTTFEIGVTTMGGQPAIYIYQSGQFFGNDDRGNPKGAYSHAYAIHFNDGINLARVTVAFTDDPRDSLEDMKRVLPRSFLERVATAFFDVYTQAWAS